MYSQGASSGGADRRLGYAARLVEAVPQDVPSPGSHARLAVRLTLLLGPGVGSLGVGLGVGVGTLVPAMGTMILGMLVPVTQSRGVTFVPGMLTLVPGVGTVVLVTLGVTFVPGMLTLSVIGRLRPVPLLAAGVRSVPRGRARHAGAMM